MPLLSDAKKIMVGGNGISKVYAGSELVWPKVNPFPSQIRTDSGGKWKGNYVTWEYAFTDCGAIYKDWSVRYGFSANVDGSGTIAWQPWNPLSDYSSVYWFYSPDHRCLAWSPPYTLENEWNSLARYTWYQVRDNRTGQTIVNEHFDSATQYVPKPSNAYSCESALPTPDVNITTDVPGDPQKRIWVVFDNTLNAGCADFGGYYVQTAYSDAADGSVQPIYWSPAERLSNAENVMIWPTYNAVLWSPDEATFSNPELNRLWYKIYYSISTNLILPVAQINMNPPSYPYSSGDGITC